MESLEEKIARVTAEQVDLVEYDPRWPILFEAERDHLRACLTEDMLGRIEHFGSTAVPGMPAKPVVDVLVEVWDLQRVRREVPPILESQGYDYFWRPGMFEGPPFYAWFIKRDAAGVRTHHVHMVEPHFEHWDRLLFRDLLIADADWARQYAALKRRLAAEHPGDRIAYTKAKTEFITRATAAAKSRFAT